MRRRRSLDELLPLTLFSSLGTNGLNSSVQTERGRKGVREGDVRSAFSGGGTAPLLVS